MKIYIRHLCMLAVAVIALACSKTQVDPQVQAREIALCTDVAETKALLSQETFGSNGNRIMVYDI